MAAAAGLGFEGCAARGRTVGGVMSDARITSEVKGRLAADDDVKALDINVDTMRGVVTLDGVVSDKKEAAEAVRIAEETRGVRRVVDSLEVVAPEGAGKDITLGQKISDRRITAMIKGKLAGDDGVEARDIDVDTHDGVVILEGEVESEQEADQAVRLAEETRGVTRVIDELNVKR
jgi:hyperosmotically inducible periplasmic protein